MAGPTERALQLLSLLQRRRDWRGAELADRLGVSERTLRRDVDRLRSLGYAIEADRGADGGYRLGAATADATLLLDDDEATALAASLHAAASGRSELAEASLGALTKVLSMMGPAQRRRAEAVRTVTEPGPAPDATAPPLAVLDALATACRDQVRLSFDYVAADGTATSRYVEPLRLVAVDARWYLVAFDVDRADWRTFRIDRVSGPTPTRNRFPARPAPAEDLYGYVRSRARAARIGQRVVIEVDAPAADLRARFGRWVEVEDLGASRCRLTMDVDSFHWPTHIVMTTDARSTVIEPERLRTHLAAVAERFAWAAAPPAPPR